MIYLADSRAICGDNIVYRFESAEHICKKVLYEYCRYYDDYTKLALGSPCGITGVCSARGGTGCSSIAMWSSAAEASWSRTFPATALRWAIPVK